MRLHSQPQQTQGRRKPCERSGDGGTKLHQSTASTSYVSLTSSLSSGGRILRMLPRPEDAPRGSAVGRADFECVDTLRTRRGQSTPIQIHRMLNGGASAHRGCQFRVTFRERPMRVSREHREGYQFRGKFHTLRARALTEHAP